MFLLAALLAATAEGASAMTTRAAQHELRQRLGGVAPATRGDFAGRIRYVLERYRDNPIVLIDVLDLVCNALREGLLPPSEWTSLWPKGVLPEYFWRQLGRTFPNPGVYSLLGELLPWFAEQFEARARALQAEGVKPYTTLVWDPTLKKWVQHPIGFPSLQGMRWDSETLNARSEGWAIWPYEFFYADLFSMLDWVRATRPVLAGLGIREAFSRSKTWHAALPMERTPGGLSRGLVVASWPDGATIERLLTPENLRDEGRAMGHCIANYADEATSGHRLYFTYRDAAGLSHASWEMERGEGFDGATWRSEPAVVQLQGPRNGAIADSLVQHRLAAWFSQNHAPIEGIHDRLAMVPGFDRRDPPDTLPVSTVPQEVWAALDSAIRVTSRAAAEAADATGWTEGQKKAAAVLVEADDEVRYALEEVDDLEALRSRFEQDRHTDTSRERLQDALDVGLEAELAPLDVEDARALRERADALATAVVRAENQRSREPSGFAHWPHSIGALSAALGARAEHLDLREALREREWFQEEEELETYDPAEEIDRVTWNLSDAVDRASAAMDAFVEAWRVSPLTSFAWTERRHRDSGRAWVRDQEEAESYRSLWLSYGYGRDGGEDGRVQAGTTGRPFSGPKTKSPLAALWRAGVVRSLVEANEDERRQKEAAATVQAYAPTSSLSPRATLATSPRAAVEAARTAGQVVPYAILRQVGME